MTDKPNCSTCPHLDESTKRYCTCRKINQQIDGEDMGFVARIGCLSHPGAREYLMAPVIEYLEQYLITETFGGYSETDVAYSKLARETIHHIRGDGK